jgi:hypothetical protein
MKYEGFGARNLHSAGKWNGIVLTHDSRRNVMRNASTACFDPPSMSCPSFVFHFSFFTIFEAVLAHQAAAAFFSISKGIKP